MPKNPEYVAIAEELKLELLNGQHDEEGSLPSNATLAERFNVNTKTAGRAIQQLIAEGFLTARPGMRPVVASPEERPSKNNASHLQTSSELVLSVNESDGQHLETVVEGWSKPPRAVAKLLELTEGDRVFRREVHMFAGDELDEISYVFYPERVVETAPGLKTLVNVGIGKLLESAGFPIGQATRKEVRASVASLEESKLFDLAGETVLVEQWFCTYSTKGQPLEMVLNIFPADGDRPPVDFYDVEA